MVHCDCFLRQSETSCVPKVQQSMNTLKRIAKKRDQRFRSGSNIVSDGQPLISSQLLPITLNLAPRVSGRAARGARFRWSAPVNGGLRGGPYQTAAGVIRDVPSDHPLRCPN